jgi:hypothetical protein
MDGWMDRSWWSGNGPWLGLQQANGPFFRHGVFASFNYYWRTLSLAASAAMAVMARASAVRFVGSIILFLVATSTRQWRMRRSLLGCCRLLDLPTDVEMLLQCHRSGGCMGQTRLLFKLMDGKWTTGREGATPKFRSCGWRITMLTASSCVVRIKY